ncbi:hypothetical protein ACKGJY_02355 [Hyunsoonleella sp. 2307UL5-6]
MSPHFCKIGKIKVNTTPLISMKQLEKRIKNFVEDISKVEFSKDSHGVI